MVRISKQQERRNTSPRKRKAPSAKTGALKDNLPEGFKPHQNALSVLKRFERIDVLKRLGRWDGTEARVTGLPKTPVTP